MSRFPRLKSDFPPPKYDFLQRLSAFLNGFPLSSTAFQFSSTAFHFPRNPRKSIYGGKYTKDRYSSFVFPATCSPSFVIPAKMSTSPPTKSLWGFLSRDVLHWLSGGLCHGRKCQFEDLDEKKRYDLRSPKERLHEKPSKKGGTGKECRY